MSAGTCPIAGCTVTMRHEHRRTHFDITEGILWVESSQQDQAMVNEARAVHGLPQLVYGDGQAATPTHELTWSPEHGIQPAGQETQALYEAGADAKDASA